MKNYYEDILEYINSLTVIDSHEHLPPREELRGEDIDVLCEWLQYFEIDLVSAGLTADELRFVYDYKKPILERWKIVEPYWELARSTAYGRMLDLSAKGVYGIERVDATTIEELNQKFKDALKPDQKHFHKVLKDLCKIEYSVKDYQLDVVDELNRLDSDKTLFRNVYRPDVFVCPRYREEIDKIEELSGIKISSFEHWLRACECMIEKALEKGAVGLKCALPYRRSLNFERSSRRDAEESFNQLMKNKRLPAYQYPGANTTKAFQDYMMHFILGIANQKGLTFQFHTGMQTGNDNDVMNGNPMYLSGLFREYPNVKFDLFHMGYPFQHVMSAFGKMYPNVYLDMCWAHILSPAACVQTLDDWLDAVPVNKIIAFGGDLVPVDCVYGHLALAKMNVSKVLARKVENGIFDLERAKWIAKRMFYDNPKSLYGA